MDSREAALAASSSLAACSARHESRRAPSWSVRVWPVTSAGTSGARPCQESAIRSPQVRCIHDDQLAHGARDVLSLRDRLQLRGACADLRRVPVMFPAFSVAGMRSAEARRSVTRIGIATLRSALPSSSGMSTAALGPPQPFVPLQPLDRRDGDCVKIAGTLHGDFAAFAEAHQVEFGN